MYSFDSLQLHTIFFSFSHKLSLCRLFTLVHFFAFFHVDNSRIGENFSFNVHYPQPPAHLEYVLIKYNKGGQVTTMQLDSPINGTNYIHLPHACNVTLAAFTAFNGLLVKPDVEWISVPGSQCIPSVFYVEGVGTYVYVFDLCMWLHHNLCSFCFFLHSSLQ